MVKTKNPIPMQAADKEDAILVAVTRDGGVFLSPGNIKLSAADQLPEKVRDLLTNRVDKTVYIKAMPAPSTQWWRTSWIICARPEWTRSD